MKLKKKDFIDGQYAGPTLTRLEKDLIIPGGLGRACFGYDICIYGELVSGVDTDLIFAKTLDARGGMSVDGILVRGSMSICKVAEVEGRLICLEDCFVVHLTVGGMLKVSGRLEADSRVEAGEIDCRSLLVRGCCSSAGDVIVDTEVAVDGDMAVGSLTVISSLNAGGSVDVRKSLVVGGDIHVSGDCNATRSIIAGRNITVGRILSGSRIMAGLADPLLTGLVEGTITAGQIVGDVAFGRVKTTKSNKPTFPVAGRRVVDL